MNLCNRNYSLLPKLLVLPPFAFLRTAGLEEAV